VTDMGENCWVPLIIDSMATKRMINKRMRAPMIREPFFFEFSILSVIGFFLQINMIYIMLDGLVSVWLARYFS